MRSSYTTKELDYGDILKTVCFLTNPTKIVEFGILDGFSLDHFVKNTNSNCIIEAYDIFDEFNGNHASKQDLEKKFNQFANISIQYGDFYKSLDKFGDNTIDILHIDIANTGEILPIVAEYMKKVKNNGILILEGGSMERDEIEWMKKYNKQPLYSSLQSLQSLQNVSYITLGKIPSITLLKKC